MLVAGPSVAAGEDGRVAAYKAAVEQIVVNSEAACDYSKYTRPVDGLVVPQLRRMLDVDPALPSAAKAMDLVIANKASAVCFTPSIDQMTKAVVDGLELARAGGLDPATARRMANLAAQYTAVQVNPNGSESASVRGVEAFGVVDPAGRVTHVFNFGLEQFTPGGPKTVGVDVCARRVGLGAFNAVAQAGVPLAANYDVETCNVELATKPENFAGWASKLPDAPGTPRRVPLIK